KGHTGSNPVPGMNDYTRSQAGVLRASALWQPTVDVRDPLGSGQTGGCFRVGLASVGRLARHARPIPGSSLADPVVDTAADAATATADCEHNRRGVAAADDHVLGSRGAMEEVPRNQS